MGCWMRVLLNRRSNQWKATSMQCRFLIRKLMSTAGPQKQANVVARVDEQRISIGIGVLFAPTVAVLSVRLLTALACELDLDLYHFDIEPPFVQSVLEKKFTCVYLRVAVGPQGRQKN